MALIEIYAETVTKSDWDKRSEANNRRAQCFPNLDMIEPDEERQRTTITPDVFLQFALARDA